MNVKHLDKMLIVVAMVVTICCAGIAGAEPVQVLAAGDLVINASSMSATPNEVSLANGPNTILFNVTDITGIAAPADNFTWIIGGETTPILDDPKYTHTFTTPNVYEVSLIANNSTWMDIPGHSLAMDQKNLDGGVIASVPIEGNFTNISTSIPFQKQFNFEFNNTKYRGIPTNWVWEFYNSSGKFDTQIKTVPIFNYNFPVIDQDYTYTVNVTATNSSVFVVDNFTTHQVEVLTVPLIVANFTNTPETCPAFPVDVSFKDNSTGFLTVDAQRWDFNDTTTSSQKDPIHQFHVPGNYRVNYTAINNSYGYQNSSQMDVFVTGLFSNFTYDMNPASGEFIPGQGIRVNFTNTAVGNPTNFAWNFGDGVNPDSPITLSYANHTYTRQGTFNVSLTVFKDCGGSRIQNTTIKPITVFETMITNFTYNPTSGKYPLSVQFLDTSSDTPIQWEWWFYDKDGVTVLNYSSLQNPSWVYNSPGIYPVKLHAVNGKGQNGTKSQSITLYDGISADFTGSPLSGIFPLDVQFNDTSLPASQVTNWNWTFGDEKPGSSMQNPSHTYERKGNFTVSLTASNSESTDTEVKGGYISVGTQITPDFTPKGLTPTRAPFVVNFTDASTPADEVSAWLWTFNDGTQAQTGRTISHQFPGPGVYLVDLNVSSFWDTRNITAEVNVTEIKVPQADFIFSPNTVNAGDTVNFEDKSVGSRPLTWLWEFGDGGVSNEQYPDYVYQYAGRYYPKLTVTNEYGEDSKTSTLPVSVRGPVIPSFITDKPDWWSVINQPVTFIDTSKGQPVSWVWDFADGTSPATVTDPQIVHTYTRAGIYNVTMTATNWVGDTKTAFHRFEVTDKDRPRDVNFDVPNYSGIHPLTVQFNQTTPSQSNVTEWLWDFGDRTNYFGNLTDPNAQRPTHTYLEPGQYSVTLTVRNDMGVNEKTRVAYVVVV